MSRPHEAGPMVDKIERWLRETRRLQEAEYVEHKLAKDRALQTGTAARVFREAIGNLDAKSYRVFQRSLAACCARRGAMGMVLSGAYVALNRALADEGAGSTRAVVFEPQEVQPVLDDYQAFLCSWVDAFIHWNLHRAYFRWPPMFDPDPDKRKLAELGIEQQNYARLASHEKKDWQERHDALAAQFASSPLWRIVGQAQASTASRLQANPRLDSAVILLWPLMRRHRWTHRTMLGILRSMPQAAPLHVFTEEGQLSSHCSNVLGLRKGRAIRHSSKAVGPGGMNAAQWVVNRLVLGMAPPRLNSS